MIKLQVLLLLLVNLAVFQAAMAESGSNNALVGGIQNDRLKWLEFDWDCDGFQDQIKARYGAFGAYSDLPEQIKGDLDTVLGVSCSKRFAHCKYENCLDSAPPSRELRAKLLAERDQRVKEKFAFRKKMIASSRKSEKKRRAVWRRFEVAGDRVFKAGSGNSKKEIEEENPNTKASNSTKRKSRKSRFRERRRSSSQ